MLRRLLIAATAALMMTDGLTSHANPADRSWSAEQQAVIDAMKKGPIGIDVDFDAWADGYHGDWSYWRVGDTATRARDEHMKLVRDYIDGGNRPVAFTMEPVDVIVRGDAALLRLIATETLQSGEGETRVVRYASATMMTRQAGEWQVLATNIVYLEN